MAPTLVARQYYDDGYYYGDSFWWTPAGLAIKYAIVAVLFFGFFLYIVGGHIHAVRRMQKGKPPLAYHRWLVSRSQRARFGFAPPQAPQNNFSFYRHQQAYPQNPENYGMYGYYAQPPPVYTPQDPSAPPMYQPPVGGSKAAPVQTSGPTSSGPAGSSSMPPPSTEVPSNDGPARPARAFVDRLRAFRR